MPLSTKKKYANSISEYEERIKKLKKSFSDLRMSRNKTNNYYDDVLLIITKRLNFIFYLLKIIK